MSVESRQHGDVELALLSCLSSEPTHGYELIRVVESRTAGSWRPSPGSIYPWLARFVARDIVTVERKGRRTLYSLTLAGEQEKLVRAPDARALWQRVRGTGSAEETFQLMLSALAKLEDGMSSIPVSEVGWISARLKRLADELLRTSDRP